MNVFRRLQNDEIFPSPTILKNEVLAEINKPKHEVLGTKNNESFFDFVEQIIRESEDGRRLTSSGNKYVTGTIKEYRKARNWLLEFQKSRKDRIAFDSINYDFYKDLVNWLYKKGMAKNTIGGHIKNLKVFLSEAFDRGITKNLEFKKRKFKVLQEETEAAYLSQEELDKIIGLDLSKNRTLDIVRDNFVVDCLIGLRIADYNNLRRDHIIEIEGVKMIKMRKAKKRKTPSPLQVLPERNQVHLEKESRYGCSHVGGYDCQESRISFRQTHHSGIHPAVHVDPPVQHRKGQAREV